MPMKAQGTGLLRAARAGASHGTCKIETGGVTPPSHAVTHAIALLYVEEQTTFPDRASS